ncbi:MAG: HEPN domain-containing protein [Bacteroidales bacterium]
MTISEENRKNLIKYRVEQSWQAVEDVEFLIEHKKLGIAVNRIYYGIFYVLSALALKYEFNTSKHNQLIGWFNKNFVKNGIVNSDISAIAHKAFSKRSKSDYAVFVDFSHEEVTEMLNEMKKFLKAIEELITK